MSTFSGSFDLTDAPYSFPDSDSLIEESEKDDFEELLRRESSRGSLLDFS